MGLHNQGYESDLRYAPDGHIWVCAACGKMSQSDRYGIEGKHSYGWDESCMLNAVLYHEATMKPVEELDNGASVE